jgi:hypothetical protein
LTTNLNGTILHDFDPSVAMGFPILDGDILTIAAEDGSADVELLPRSVFGVVSSANFASVVDIEPSGTAVWLWICTFQVYFILSF